MNFVRGILGDVLGCKKETVLSLVGREMLACSLYRFAHVGNVDAPILFTRKGVQWTVWPEVLVGLSINPTPVLLSRVLTLYLLPFPSRIFCSSFMRPACLLRMQIFLHSLNISVVHCELPAKMSVGQWWELWVVSPQGVCLWMQPKANYTSFSWLWEYAT